VRVDQFDQFKRKSVRIGLRLDVVVTARVLQGCRIVMPDAL